MVWGVGFRIGDGVAKIYKRPGIQPLALADTDVTPTEQLAVLTLTFAAATAVVADYADLLEVDVSLMFAAAGAGAGADGIPTKEPLAVADGSPHTA